MFEFVATFHLHVGMRVHHIIRAASMCDAMTRAMLYASRIIPDRHIARVEIVKNGEEPVSAEIFAFPNPTAERARIMQKLQHDNISSLLRK